ncbi:hypothetical protein NC651_019116 [Populus alba x Populus x berolinensis]|nr:hypothetical protein NC651_019116 [Populus alba x Populus x berolinensis]
MEFFPLQCLKLPSNISRSKEEAKGTNEALLHFKRMALSREGYDFVKSLRNLNGDKGNRRVWKVLQAFLDQTQTDGQKVEL